MNKRHVYLQYYLRLGWRGLKMRQKLKKRRTGTMAKKRKEKGLRLQLPKNEV